MSLFRKFYPTISQAIVLLIMYIIISGFVGLLGGAMVGFTTNESDISPLHPMVIFFSYVLVMLLVLWFARRRFNTINRFTIDWKIKAVSLLNIGIVILMGLSIVIIEDPIISLIPTPDYILELFKELLQINIWTFLSVVIAAPILEELLFRGLILNGFLKNYSPWKAVLWSSFIFALFHMNPWQGIGAFTLGILLGWAYIKTNSIIPCIAIHFAVNLFAFIGIASTEDIDSTLWDLFSNKVFFFMLLALAVIILISGIQFLRKMPNQNFLESSEPEADMTDEEIN